MKLATINVYCIINIDVPVLISEDINIDKLTQSDVHELINQNKIKLSSGRIEKLFDKCNVIKDTINILVDAENCNSFRLSKINHIADKVKVDNAGRVFDTCSVFKVKNDFV